MQTTGILADMLLNSTFQPDAIEREKKTILQVAKHFLEALLSVEAPNKYLVKILTALLLSRRWKKLRK